MQASTPSFGNLSKNLCNFAGRRRPGGEGTGWWLAMHVLQRATQPDYSRTTPSTRRGNQRTNRRTPPPPVAFKAPTPPQVDRARQPVGAFLTVEDGRGDRLVGKNKSECLRQSMPLTREAGCLPRSAGSRFRGGFRIAAILSRFLAGLGRRAPSLTIAVTESYESPSQWHFTRPARLTASVPPGNRLGHATVPHRARPTMISRRCGFAYARVIFGNRPAACSAPSRI